MEYGKSVINLFVTNGTGSVANNDDKFLYGIKAERLFGKFRLGTTAVVNNAEQNEQSMFNLYGGLNLGDFTFLTEVDWIETEQNDSTDRTQLVGLFEVNYQLHQGLNLKLTSEYFDPDDDVDENQETRHSFVIEYVPISNLQLRLGLRSSEGIPQQPRRSSERFFLQSHLYF